MVQRQLLCASAFKLGQQVAVYGRLEASRSQAEAGRFKLIQPQFEILSGPRVRSGARCGVCGKLEMGRIVPVYESLGGNDSVGSEADLEVDAAGDVERVSRSWSSRMVLRPRRRCRRAA